MKTKKITPFVVIVLLAILCAGIGYSILRQKTPADSQANVTTYTNTEFGYTVDYPTNWKIDTSRSTANEVVFDIGIAGSRESIKVETTTKTLDQWVKEFDEEIVLKTSDTTIDGLPAKQVETSEFGTNYISVKKYSNLYTFTTGGRMIENGMLASFKFSRTSSLNETISWTTYTSKQFGITAKYPSDWKVDDTKTANWDAEGVITFYKEAATTSSPSLTITINAVGRGVSAAEIHYDIAYENDTMNVSNRRINTDNEMGDIVKGKVHFWNNYGSNIELEGKTCYMVGENLSNRTDEDKVVSILSSFTLTK